MPLTIVCQHCGNTVESTPERVAHQRFCSDKCRYRARDAKRNTRRGTKVTTDCASCGKAFTYESGTAPRRYCPECKGSSRRRTRPTDRADEQPASGAVFVCLKCAGSFPRGATHECVEVPTPVWRARMAARQ